MKERTYLDLIREMLERGLINVDNVHEANKRYNELSLLNYTTELMSDNITSFLRKHGRN